MRKLFQQASLWVQARHPVLKFLLGFIGCMVLFYIFYYSALYRNHLEGPFLHAQASISNLLLRLLGQGTEVFGSSIAGKDFSVDLKNGCDGLEAIAIFISGILIFPVSFRLKARGIGWGVFTLLILNLLRIAGLYLVGLHFPPAVFEVFHVQGGFVIFTMISVILWFAWMNWATKQPPPTTEKE
ncbi:MAG: archaeosortase/exosortase family protein [Saprospirales bacterium]|nr:archaeosortase/exosortase family protein [Saprospirales bacterium]